MIRYEPATGRFFWIADRRAVRAGDEAGTIHKNGYRYVRVDGRAYRASRLAWFYSYGAWPNGDIDHKDLVRANDRLENLREASRSQNKANQVAYANNVLGLKGVHKRTDKNYKKPYVGRISVAGKSKHLGYFETAELARAAVLQESRRAFGEYAR